MNLTFTGDVWCLANTTMTRLAALPGSVKGNDKYFHYLRRNQIIREPLPCRRPA
ncbi:hypothetical protein [Halotalea alkalilenta]|uniref:hypothetical protein n=1 Tax=Halotalea alkalilenta TaxID=376489 RepID=UPI001681C26B|nr:hypothetical protein [Halotalea alkalilenta]